jgi:hypothetical protein
MEFERYEDVIDAFERDNMGYNTLTDYIKGENIKIAEIDMSPMGDLAKAFNKKDGGMMIAIEQLGQGGITGGKTYHQYHDSFVPRDEESMGYANGGGVGSMMQPKKKFVEQDGFLNYIKNSDSVTVPKRFKARENAPATKLAYITDAEAKMLKKQNKGTPHKGPSGIPSYDSFDAQGGYTSGTAMSAAETGSTNARDRAEIRASNIGGPKGLAPGVKSQEEIALRNAAIVAGAGQRVNPGFFDSRNTISPQELALARASDPRTFNKVRGTGGIMGFLKSGGLFGNLLRGLGQKFGLGKTYDQPTYDMSEFSDYGLGGTPPGTLDFDPNAKIQNTSFIKKKPPVNVNIKDSMNEDFGIYESPPTGIMKAGGYPGDYGVVPFNPGMGASPTGIQYPGGEPNFVQDIMEQDAGIYAGLPNQKLANAAAMEVFKQGFRNANYEGLPQGSPGQLNPEPITSMMPNPTEDLFVDNSTNTNQELLENIINKNMYEKNLEPAINRQKKQNNILEQMLLEESTLT